MMPLWGYNSLTKDFKKDLFISEGQIYSVSDGEKLIITKIPEGDMSIWDKIELFWDTEPGSTDLEFRFKLAVPKGWVGGILYTFKKWSGWSDRKTMIYDKFAQEGRYSLKVQCRDKVTKKVIDQQTLSWRMTWDYPSICSAPLKVDWINAYKLKSSRQKYKFLAEEFKHEYELWMEKFKREHQKLKLVASPGELIQSLSLAVREEAKDLLLSWADGTGHLVKDFAARLLLPSLIYPIIQKGVLELIEIYSDRKANKAASTAVSAYFAWKFYHTVSSQKIYTVIVDKGQGIIGSPLTQTVMLKSGDRLNYHYGLKSGFRALKVELNGLDVSQLGSIVVEDNYTLKSSAEKEPGKPKIDSFAVNNGEVSTAERKVILNNQCSGYPLYYMASEDRKFSGEAWKLYAEDPEFILSPAPGLKIVFLKVKNNTSESKVVRDIINLVYIGPTETYEFVLKWGKTGTGEGEFDIPTALTIDKTDHIYVLDSLNRRVQKFDTDGKFILEWGEWGVGDGRFFAPTGIAVDDNGNVFVSDVFYCNVQKFSSEGIFLKRWGGKGNGDGEFQRPVSLGVDKEGYVYVSDNTRNCIQKFTNDGLFVMKWGTTGSLAGELSGPVGIAFDDLQNIWVAEFENCRLQQFSPSGQSLQIRKLEKPADAVNMGPGGITIDDEGSLYLVMGDLDLNYCWVYKYSSNGDLLAEIGSRGEGDGQFMFPVDIKVDSSGYVYVTDAEKDIVLKYKKNIEN